MNIVFNFKIFHLSIICILLLFRYPFNDSKRVGKSLKMIEDSLKPGPGHYDINVQKRCSTDGPTSVFKSTTAQRLQTIRQGYSIFD